jgi:hypothetical protein
LLLKKLSISDTKEIESNICTIKFSSENERNQDVFENIENKLAEKFLAFEENKLNNIRRNAITRKIN